MYCREDIDREAEQEGQALKRMCAIKPSTSKLRKRGLGFTKTKHTYNKDKFDKLFKGE